MKKNISITILKTLVLAALLMSSCSSNKQLSRKQLDAVVCINDFIANYNNLITNRPLEGLLLYRENGDYVIMNAPEEVLLATLKEPNTKSNKAKIGMYKGLPCQYYRHDFKFFSAIFETPDTALKNKSSIQQSEYEGSIITFGDGMLEWEPSLTITYKIDKQIREFYFKGKTEVKKLEIKN